MENKLILGTVQFGINYGINNSLGKPTINEVDEILVEGYKKGIRFLDTAEAYGNAHELIGKFHQKYTDYQFDVITKLPHKFDGSVNRIETYLKQLHITKLKCLMFHSYESYKLSKEFLPKLDTFIEKGKIDSIGVSVYTNKQIEEVINNQIVKVIQLPFNLLDNINLRGEFLMKAKSKGITIHTRSAFLQGLFFIDPTDSNKIFNTLRKELLFIHEIAKDEQISMQKLALNYCLQQKAIDNVLIGVDNLKQLKQNLDDSNYTISENIIRQIDSIFIKNVDLLNPSLWN